MPSRTSGGGGGDPVAVGMPGVSSNSRMAGGVPYGSGYSCGSAAMTNGWSSSSSSAPPRYDRYSMLKLMRACYRPNLPGATANRPRQQSNQPGGYVAAGVSDSIRFGSGPLETGGIAGTTRSGSGRQLLSMQGSMAANTMPAPVSTSWAGASSGRRGDQSAAAAAGSEGYWECGAVTPSERRATGRIVPGGGSYISGGGGGAGSSGNKFGSPSSPIGFSEESRSAPLGKHQLAPSFGAPPSDGRGAIRNGAGLTADSAHGPRSTLSAWAAVFQPAAILPPSSSLALFPPSVYASPNGSAHAEEPAFGFRSTTERSVTARRIGLPGVGGNTFMSPSFLPAVGQLQGSLTPMPARGGRNVYATPLSSPHPPFFPPPPPPPDQKMKDRQRSTNAKTSKLPGNGQHRSLSAGPHKSGGVRPEGSALPSRSAAAAADSAHEELLQRVVEVVKNAGPEGIGAECIVSEYLKSHNSFLYLRSLGYRNILQLVAACWPALKLERKRVPEQGDASMVPAAVEPKQLPKTAAALTAEITAGMAATAAKSDTASKAATAAIELKKQVAEDNKAASTAEASTSPDSSTCATAKGVDASAAAAAVGGEKDEKADEPSARQKEKAENKPSSIDDVKQLQAAFDRIAARAKLASENSPAATGRATKRTTAAPAVSAPSLSTKFANEERHLVVKYCEPLEPKERRELRALLVALVAYYSGYVQADRAGALHTVATPSSQFSQDAATATVASVDTTASSSTTAYDVATAPTEELGKELKPASSVVAGTEQIKKCDGKEEKTEKQQKSNAITTAASPTTAGKSTGASGKTELTIPAASASPTASSPSSPSSSVLPIGVFLTNLPALWRMHYGTLLDLKTYQTQVHCPQLQDFIKDVPDLQIVTTAKDVRVRVSPGASVPDVSTILSHAWGGLSPTSAAAVGPGGGLGLPACMGGPGGASPASVASGPHHVGVAAFSPSHIRYSPTGKSEVNDSDALRLMLAMRNGTHAVASPTAAAALQTPHSYRSSGAVAGGSAYWVGGPPPPRHVGAAVGVSSTPTSLSGGDTAGVSTASLPVAHGGKNEGGGGKGEATATMAVGAELAPSHLNARAIASQLGLAIVPPSITRQQLRKLLFELVTVSCERQRQAWLRGEDLVELEEEEWTSLNAMADEKLGGKSSANANDTDEEDEDDEDDHDDEEALDKGKKSGSTAKKAPRKNKVTGEDADVLEDDDSEDDEDDDSDDGMDEDLEGLDEDEKDSRIQRYRRKKREKKEKKRRRRRKLRVLERLTGGLAAASTTVLPNSTASTAAGSKGTAGQTPTPAVASASPSFASTGGAAELCTASSQGGELSTSELLQLTSSVACPGVDDASLPASLEAAAVAEEAAEEEHLAAATGVAPASVHLPSRPVASAAGTAASTAAAPAAGGSGVASRPLTVQGESPFQCLQLLKARASASAVEWLRRAYQRRTVGMLVSSVKVEWGRRFGDRAPLAFYMRLFRVRRMKFLLVEVPNLVIAGAGGFMRVASAYHVKLVQMAAAAAEKEDPTIMPERPQEEPKSPQLVEHKTAEKLDAGYSKHKQLSGAAKPLAKGGKKGEQTALEGGRTVPKANEALADDAGQKQQAGRTQATMAPKANTSNAKPGKEGGGTALTPSHLDTTVQNKKLTVVGASAVDAAAAGDEATPSPTATTTLQNGSKPAEVSQMQYQQQRQQLLPVISTPPSPMEVFDATKYLHLAGTTGTLHGDIIRVGNNSASAKNQSASGGDLMSFPSHSAASPSGHGRDGNFPSPAVGGHSGSSMRVHQNVSAGVGRPAYGHREALRGAAATRGLSAHAAPYAPMSGFGVSSPSAFSALWQSAASYPQVQSSRGGGAAAVSPSKPPNTWNHQGQEHWSPQSSPVHRDIGMDRLPAHGTDPSSSLHVSYLQPQQESRRSMQRQPVSRRSMSDALASAQPAQRRGASRQSEFRSEEFETATSSLSPGGLGGEGGGFGLLKGLGYQGENRPAGSSPEGGVSRSREAERALYSLVAATVLCLFVEQEGNSNEGYSGAAASTDSSPLPRYLDNAPLADRVAYVRSTPDPTEMAHRLSRLNLRAVRFDALKAEWKIKYGMPIDPLLSACGLSSLHDLIVRGHSAGVARRPQGAEQPDAQLENEKKQPRMVLVDLPVPGDIHRMYTGILPIPRRAPRQLASLEATRALVRRGPAPSHMTSGSVPAFADEGAARLRRIAPSPAFGQVNEFTPPSGLRRTAPLPNLAARSEARAVAASTRVAGAFGSSPSQGSRGVPERPGGIAAEWLRRLASALAAAQRASNQQARTHESTPVARSSGPSLGSRVGPPVVRTGAQHVQREAPSGRGRDGVYPPSTHSMPPNHLASETNAYSTSVDAHSRPAQPGRRPTTKRGDQGAQDYRGAKSPAYAHIADEDTHDDSDEEDVVTHRRGTPPVRLASSTSDRHAAWHELRTMRGTSTADPSRPHAEPENSPGGRSPALVNTLMRLLDQRGATSLVRNASSTGNSSTTATRPSPAGKNTAEMKHLLLSALLRTAALRAGVAPSSRQEPSHRGSQHAAVQAAPAAHRAVEADHRKEAVKRTFEGNRPETPTEAAKDNFAQGAGTQGDRAAQLTSLLRNAMGVVRPASGAQTRSTGSHQGSGAATDGQQTAATADAVRRLLHPAVPAARSADVPAETAESTAAASSQPTRQITEAPSSVVAATPDRRTTTTKSAQPRKKEKRFTQQTRNTIIGQHATFPGRH
eukprot:GHVT01075510.1.p1 GENE.GHVT01075510.1~~GHVT01075510.1.p1  ORF type:complete len:2724 (+),score=560.90 GHVT01075510.1:791-8962(+)